MRPPSPFLETPLGALYRAEAIRWMSSLPEGCARLIVADPPYNIGKASWDLCGSPARYLEWTARWVRAAHRLLAPDGSMYLCGYPEPLAGIAARVGPLFSSWRSLVWHYRNKASMTDDWGRAHEGILHLRKGRRIVFNTDDVRVPYNRHTVRYPAHPQAVTSQFSGGRGRRPGAWTPHPAGARPRDVIEIPTLCNGSAEKTRHPTQKPEELIRRLVLASSREGDLVIDPFGGAGTTYVVCEMTARRWLGCERRMSYCRIAGRRLAEPERFRPSTARETPQARARRRAMLRGGV